MNTYRTPAKLHVTHELLHASGRITQSATIQCTYCVHDRAAWLQMTQPLFQFLAAAMWDEDARFTIEVEGVCYDMDLREETLIVEGHRMYLTQCGVEDLIYLYSGAVA